MNNRIVLVNSFSLSMVAEEDLPFVKFQKLFIDEIRDDMSWCELESNIGSQEIADCLAHLFKVEIPVNRKGIKFDGSFRLIVAHVSGGPIPPGSVTIPKGTRLRFQEVIIDRIPVIPMHDFEAVAMENWPIDQLMEEGPTMIRINWKNGEHTHLQIAPGMDGEWAAYVHSRSGRHGDFIAACSQQTWQDVIKKEEAA